MSRSTYRKLKTVLRETVETTTLVARIVAAGIVLAILFGYEDDRATRRELLSKLTLVDARCERLETAATPPAEMPTLRLEAVETLEAVDDGDRDRDRSVSGDAFGSSSVPPEPAIPPEITSGAESP